MIQGFSTGLLNRELIYNLDLPSFQRDFASLKTLDHGTGPAITFTRGSTATYFDADGVLQTAANDVARFDHDPATGASRGLLIEEARTNSIRNSQAGGSTNGVIGSGGVMPTNWFLNAPAGITREVVATGSLSGFNYIDFRFSGTPSSNGQQLVYFDSNAAASIGQTWTNSVYAALIAGNLTNVGSLRVTVEESSGSFLVASTTNLTSISANLSRFSVTRTFNNASVTGAAPYITFNVTSGNPIDLTLRIAAPQLEEGAFPTSYIPTTTAAATRSADSAVVTPISGFYNQSEGTLFAEASYPASAANGGIFQFDNETANDRMFLYFNSLNREFFVRTTAGTQAQIARTGGTSANTVYKLIGAYKGNDFQFATDGTTGTADTSGVVPSVTHMRVGRTTFSSANFLNGHIRKIAYWPKRLTNALLEQLTT